MFARFISNSLFVFAVLFSIVSAMFAGTPSLDIKEDFEFAGITRRFILHIPALKPGAGKRPFIFALHGGGGTAEGMIRLTCGKLNSLADRFGVFICYPQGLEKQWNDGRKIESSRAHRENIDDVGFLCSLVDYLARRYPIDSKRLFSCGMSNGAFMSMRLALEVPAKFRAVGIVGGGMSKILAGKYPCSKAPVSVIIINGTRDWLVPWKGGDIGGRLRRGIVMPTRWTVNYWVRANHCKSRSNFKRFPNRTWDWTRVWSETHTGGINGTKVTLVCVRNGGHTWPGGHKYLPALLVGRTSRDVDASVLLFRFFLDVNI